MGIVSTSRLNEIMQEAIDVGYDDSLDNASIHSWVWTPHPEEEEIVDSRWIKIN
mgnify:CR=1 FL=1